MGFLSSYQQKIFNSFRSKVRDEEITLVTLISSGSGNSYGEGVTESETRETVLCKIGWSPVFEKSETAGGYEEIGDAQVILSYDDMSKIQEDNIYLETASGGNLAILRITPAELSGECLVICKKK